MSDEQPATRTRLPTHGADTPGRRSNPMLSGVGALVVVLVIIGALLFAADRSGGGGDDAGSASSGGGPAGDAKGAPLAQAELPARVEADVPVGYPRTAEGAQSAAANFVVAYGSDRMFQEGPRRAVITAIADPVVRDGLIARADQAFRSQTEVFGLDAAGRAPKGMTFVCRTVPMGTRSVGFSPDSATVEVWSTGIVGLAGPTSVQPVAEAWSTTTMRLSWVNGDWKMAEFSQKEGPTPVSGLQAPSGAEDIAKADREFGELRHAR